jgi:hypothetical protein
VIAGALLAPAVRPMRSVMSSCGAHSNKVDFHSALMCFRRRRSRWRIVPPAQRLGTARWVRAVVAKPPWLPPAGGILRQVHLPSFLLQTATSDQSSPQKSQYLLHHAGTC